MRPRITGLRRILPVSLTVVRYCMQQPGVDSGRQACQRGAGFRERECDSPTRLSTRDRSTPASRPQIGPPTLGGSEPTVIDACSAYLRYGKMFNLTPDAVRQHWDLSSQDSYGDLHCSMSTISRGRRPRALSE